MSTLEGRREAKESWAAVRSARLPPCERDREVGIRKCAARVMGEEELAGSTHSWERGKVTTVSPEAGRAELSNQQGRGGAEHSWWHLPGPTFSRLLSGLPSECEEQPQTHVDSRRGGTGLGV